MAKDLKKILAGSKSSKEQKMDLSDWEKSKDGQAFAAQHKIEKHADRVGNGDDVYKGKTKEAKFPKQKDSVYESKMKCESCGNMYEGDSCGCGKMGKGSKKLILSGDKKKLEEVLTKKTSSGEVIHDFVHSDNPKFAGKSKAERTKMALGAYYSMHTGKKKVNEAKDDTAEEISMVTTELKSMIHDAEELLNKMPKGMHIEPWVQAKVAMAKASICSIHDYIIYGNIKEDVKPTATPSKSEAWTQGNVDGYYGRPATPRDSKRKTLTNPKDIADYMSGHKDDSTGSKVYEDLAIPMLEDGKKKKKKKMEAEQADTPITTGGSFSSSGPDGRV